MTQQLQITIPKTSREIKVWEKVLGVSYARFMSRITELAGKPGDLEAAKAQIDQEIAALPPAHVWALGEHVAYIKEAHAGGLVLRKGLEVRIVGFSEVSEAVLKEDPGARPRYIYAEVDGWPVGVQLAIPYDQAEDYIEVRL